MLVSSAVTVVAGVLVGAVVGGGGDVGEVVAGWCVAGVAREQVQRLPMWCPPG
jgi:hypothetical protein